MMESVEESWADRVFDAGHERMSVDFRKEQPFSEVDPSISYRRGPVVLRADC